MHRWLVQELLQLPDLNQLLEIISRSSVIFRSVPMVLMILAIKTLVTLSRVSSHLIQPLEIWFILYLINDLVYKFPKNYVIV